MEKECLTTYRFKKRRKQHIIIKVNQEGNTINITIITHGYSFPSIFNTYFKY